MASKLIAVTGATGQVGGRVARRLADRGAALRLLARDPSRAPQLPGAEVVVGGYEDAGAFQEALRGVHTLFLVSATEHADRAALHRSAVDAAAAAGVARIVYLSFLAAADDATFTFARDHWHTEQHLREAGVGFVFLRDSLYQDVLPYFADRGGVIRGPAGDGRFAPVARDDVADVATVVLLDDWHDGLTYDLTGPELLTMAGVAEELSLAAGRPVRYQPETLAQAYESRARFNAEEWEVTGWVTSYAAIAAGELDEVSQSVAKVAGHPPMALRQFLERYPDSVSHLRPT